MPFFLSRGARCNRRRSGPIQAPPRASSTAATSSEDHHHLADTCTADSDHNNHHHHHPHHRQMSSSMPVIVPLHGQWDAGHAVDASHKRQRQTSWSSIAGTSEPIDIPPHSNSPQNDPFFGEFETITTALTGGDYTDSSSIDINNNNTSMNGYSSAPCRPDASGEVGCWSASWYRSEPWKNSEALESGTPEKPPAHIMIWEERTARSASQAAALAARESMGRRALSDADDEDDDDELPSRGDTSSEDSIFEMDM